MKANTDFFHQLSNKRIEDLDFTKIEMPKGPKPSIHNEIMKFIEELKEENKLTKINK